MRIGGRANNSDDDDHDHHPHVDDDCDDDHVGYHRHPSRLEDNFILVAFAPFHWGHTFPDYVYVYDDCDYNDYIPLGSHLSWQ